MNAAKLLAFLEKLNENTNCVLRVNSAGAWCLHETRVEGDGFPTVRLAIEAFIEEHGEEPNITEIMEKTYGKIGT